MKTSPKFARLIKRIGKSLLILAILLATQSSLPVFLAGTANQAGNFYQAAAAGDPVIAAAGDIACDPSNSIFNNGQGNSNACRALYTSNLLVNAGLAAVLDLGDNQYYCGGYQAFLQSYDLSWGRVKSITHPSVGNHEYLTSGGTDCNAANTNAAGYFQYFGSAAGTQGQGWYSFNVGSWHLIALNSNCSNAGGCGTTSAQYKFLQADLAAHPNQCTLAYWHIPLYSSGGRSAANSKPFWTLLYNAHADIILNGHDHIYERFAPQDPNAGVDATNGIREFIVGTGGSDHTTVTTVAANSLVRNPSTFGVLKLTLHAGSYDWAFVPEAGKTFTDSGSANCHASGSSNPTPTPTATVALTNTPTSTPTGTLAATNTPTLTPTGTLVATNTPTTTPNSGGSTVIILPVVDTYVNGGSTTTNYGNSTTLRLDASPDLHGLLRFNISGLGGASISQALLSFYPRNSDSQGIRAWAVSNNTWGELTTNYTNAPPLGGQLASTGSFPAGIRINMNVTAYVTGEGSYSFGVTNISSTAISVDSREAGATAPQLILTLNGSSGPTATPTATLAATNTPTPTATGTLAVTNTPTQTPTSTATLVVTNTPTPPPTGTLAATNTPTSTPTTGAGQSLTFTSQSDTYVDSSTPTVNNGTRTTLRADASPIVNSYLRFGVSGLSGTVTSVHLLIFANSSLGSGLKALAVADTTWGETSMTYNNAPALGSVLATAGSITSGTWVNLDVTGYISADGTYSFGITSSNATAISLASRESGANAPQLVITTQ